MSDDNAVVDSVENTDAGQTVDTAPDNIEEAIDNLTIDDLMNMTSDDDPVFADDATHKGMKPLSHWMQHMPEDVRKHVANLRSDYTRKTQEVAQMRKDLEAQMERSRSQSESIMNGAVAKQLQNINVDEEYDLFETEGMKKEIQRQAQLMLKEMFKPAQEEMQVQQRKLELDKFKMENPELTDPKYKGEIVNLLKTRPELKLEDAFYIAKSKLGAIEVDQAKSELQERRNRRREVARKSAGGTRSAPSGKPKFKSAVEAFKWHRSQQVKK